MRIARRTGHLLFGVVLVWVLCSAVTAHAQLTGLGRLTGTVTDAAGAPMPGVPVVATSPSLIGEQATVTQVTGAYLFPALPPGEYTLLFDLTGFRRIRREGIVLEAGKTLRIDAQLELSAVEETITIVGAPPVVDIGSVKIGESFAGAKLVDIPTATDVWAMIALTPGVRLRGFDVGGSHKSQQGPYTAYGMSGQAKIVYDGVETTEGTGGTGIYADFLSVQEITIVGAGHDVEMPNAGITLISTYKSGGNNFSGMFNLSYEPESFVGENITDDLVNRGFTGNRNVKFWEGHAELGGPIAKDKVWFFVAYNHFTIDRTVSGIEYDPSDPHTSDLGKFDTWTTKETARIGDNGTLTAYYQRSRKYKPWRGLSARMPFESTFIQDSISQVVKGDYQHVWNDRTYSSVKYGWFGLDWPVEANADFKSTPMRYDLATGLYSGAYFYTFDVDMRRPQVQALTTHYVPDAAGSHDLKFGYEWQRELINSGLNGNSGQMMYYDIAGSPFMLYAYDFGPAGKWGDTWGGKGDYLRKNSFYAQDAWSPTDRLTVNAGIRVDLHTSGINGGARRPVLSDLFPNRDIAAKEVMQRTSWSPRLSAIYNLSSAGTTVLKAGWARYNWNPTYVIGYYQDPSGDSYKGYLFNDLNGDNVYSGPEELGPLVASGGGGSYNVDPDLEYPTTSELTLSLEHQFWGETSIRASWVRKRITGQYAMIRPQWEGSFNVPTSVRIDITNEYGTPGSTVQDFTLYDSDVPMVDTSYQLTNIAGDNGESTWDTLTVAFNKRFGGGQYVAASFDLSRADSLKYPYVRGGPLYTSEPYEFYSQTSMVNRDVPPRQATNTWQARAHGRFNLPAELALGVAIRAQSGFQWARTAYAVLPNAGFVTFWTEPLNKRSDTVVIADLRVDKFFRFGRYQISGMIDVFNALNANPVTAFDGGNGPNFGRVYAALEPRTIMASLRFTF